MLEPSNCFLKNQVPLLYIKFVLILCFLFSIYSCSQGSQNLIPDSTPEQFDHKDIIGPEDDGELAPTTIASPPVLFLKAQGHFEEDEGLFHIRGEVVDKNNRPVNQALVTIDNERTRQSSESFTNRNGSFEGHIPVQIGDQVFVQASLPDLNLQSNTVEFTVVKDFLFLYRYGFSILDLEEITKSEFNPDLIKVPYESPVDFALSHDEKFVYFIYHENPAFRVFDIENKNFLDLNHDGLVNEDDFVPLPDNPYKIHVDPKGKFIYIAYGATYFFDQEADRDEDQTAYLEGRKMRVMEAWNYQIFDLNSDGHKNSDDDLRFEVDIRDVYFDTQNDKAYISGDRGTILVLNTLTHQVIQRIHLPFSIIHHYVYLNSYVSGLNFWNGMIVASVKEVFEDQDDQDIKERSHLFIINPQDLNQFVKMDIPNYGNVEVFEDQAYIIKHRDGKNLFFNSINSLIDIDTQFFRFRHRDDNVSAIDLADEELLFSINTGDMFFKINGDDGVIYIYDDFGRLKIEDLGNVIFDDFLQMIDNRELNINYMSDFDYELGPGVPLESQISNSDFLYFFNRRVNYLKKINLNSPNQNSYIHKIFNRQIDEFIFSENPLLENYVVRNIKSDFQRYSFVYIGGGSFKMTIIDNFSKTYVDTNNDGELNQEDIIDLAGTTYSNPLIISEDGRFMYLIHRTYDGESNKVFIKVFDLQNYRLSDLNQDGLVDENDFIPIPVGFIDDETKYLGSYPLLRKEPGQNYFYIFFRDFAYMFDYTKNKIVDINGDQIINRLDALVFWSNHNHFFADLDSSDLFFEFYDDKIYYISRNYEMLDEGIRAYHFYKLDLSSMSFIDLNKSDDFINDFILIEGSIKSLKLIPENSQAILKMGVEDPDHEGQYIDKFTILDLETHEFFDLNIREGYPDDSRFLFYKVMVSSDKKYAYIHNRIDNSINDIEPEDQSIISIIDLKTRRRVDRNNDGLSDYKDDLRFIDIEDFLLSRNNDFLYIYSSDFKESIDEFNDNDVVDHVALSYNNCSIKVLNTETFDFEDLNHNGIYDSGDEFQLGQCVNGDLGLSLNGDYLYTMSMEGFHLIDLWNNQSYLMPLHELFVHFDFVIPRYDGFYLNIPW